LPLPFLTAKLQVNTNSYLIKDINLKHKKQTKIIIYSFFIISLIVSFSLFIIYFKQRADNKRPEPVKTEKNITLDNFIDRKLILMPIDEKRGVLFMVGINGTKLSNADEKFLKENHIGGVILLGGNIKSEAQVKELTSDIRTKVDSHMIIAIDQEGGTVVRIPWDKYTDVSARNLGNKDDKDYTKEVAVYRANLLKELGVNLLLGPVADVADKGSFLYDRSYSSSPEKAADYVDITVTTDRQQGIFSAIKHFPGHGATSVDSHSMSPVINKNRAELENNDWVPFKAGINAGSEFVMLGHIINPQIDPKKPASISEEYLKILENDLHFQGVIITDDLKMTGNIKGGINWGINMSIEDRAVTENRMRSISPDDKYVRRVLELKYKKL
jgi:beta-N-acetylhexosaminidase